MKLHEGTGPVVFEWDEAGGKEFVDVADSISLAEDVTEIDVEGIGLKASAVEATVTLSINIFLFLCWYK